MGVKRITRVVPSTLSISPTNTMKLIRTLLDRLSDSLFVSVPETLGLATELSNIPPLRLVSDKFEPSTSVDAATRRSASHSISHVDALDDAIRRSQAWFLSRQHA